MNETDAELHELSQLLDRSAGERRRHLTDIATAERRLSAERIAADIRGAVVLNVATVTRSGEPRLSAVDGHFIHGHWYFSTAAAAVKTRHLTQRPAISVAYTPRDGYGLWAHGTPVRLEGVEAQRIDRFLSAYYGMALSDMADGIAIFRVDAHWMLGFAMTEQETAAFEPQLDARVARLDAALAELG